MDITELTVHELQEKIKNKELTITEITKAYVDRMNEKEKDVQAFITERKAQLTHSMTDLQLLMVSHILDMYLQELLRI